jgi:hypothetical protein
MKFYSFTKKNEILSFAGKWMELEIIILSEASQVQSIKTIYFLSYVEYRPNTNIVILWKTDAKGMSHMRGGR